MAYKTRKKKEKLTAKQRIAALVRVGKISYQAAPSVLYVRIVSAVLDSSLPILTTFLQPRQPPNLLAPITVRRALVKRRLPM